MCNLLEKTIDFDYRMRFLKYLRAKTGDNGKIQKIRVCGFLRAWSCWRWTCVFFAILGRFLQKIQKGFAAMARLKCFKNEKTREKTRQKRREQLKNKNVAKK